MTTCPSCGSQNTVERMLTHTFLYGLRDCVPLEVTEPVITCNDCSESFTDWRGEGARAETVARYRRAFWSGGVEPQRRMIAVFGGRAFTNAVKLNSALVQLHADYKFSHLMNGAAEGADAIADQWARLNGVQPVACAALWDFYRMPQKKNPAGPLRNQRMIELEPEFGLCCPGGKGTADMLERFKGYMKRKPSSRLWVMRSSGEFEEAYP